MEVRRLLEGAHFGAEALTVVYQAFDAAWTEIAHHFEIGSEQAKQARLRLGHAMLIVATDESRDPDQLKADALQVMALAYKRKPAPRRRRRDKIAATTG